MGIKWKISESEAQICVNTSQAKKINYITTVYNVPGSKFNNFYPAAMHVQRENQHVKCRASVRREFNEKFYF